MENYDFFWQTEHAFQSKEKKNIFPLKKEEKKKPWEKEKEDQNLFQKNAESYQKRNSGIGNSNFAPKAEEKPGEPKEKPNKMKSVTEMGTNATQIPRNLSMISNNKSPKANTDNEQGWDAWESFAYGSERVAQGMVGALEGVGDFVGVGLGKPLQWVTSLGGLTPNPVSDGLGSFCENLLSYDVAGEYGKNIRARYHPSEQLEKVTSINEFAGSLVPSMLTAGATSIPALGYVVNAAMTAGQAMQDGYQQSGDVDQAITYGSVYGGLDAIVSSFAGGIPLLPEGKLTKAVSKVIKDPTMAKGLQMAADAVGEGGEEMIMQTLDPYIKRATVDGNAPNASAEEVLEAGLRAVALSAILQAGGAVTDKIGQSDRFSRYKDGRDMFLEGFYWIDDPEVPRVFDSKKELDFYEGLTGVDNQNTATYYGKGADARINALKSAGDVQVLQYVPTSKATIYTTPGVTTTVLGRYDPDTMSILEELEYEKSLNFGPREGGLNLLNAPDGAYKDADQFWNEINRPWLDQAIQRGDIIVLATLPGWWKLKQYNHTTGKFEQTGFGREYEYLREHGYVYDRKTRTMRPQKQEQE